MIGDLPAGADAGGARVVSYEDKDLQLGSINPPERWGTEYGV